MDSPRITVLTPTFNRPLYLKIAIASVIGQTEKNWEMIVINDGGTDVGDIISGFNDSRIRYFNRVENCGKAVCLNFALKEARGDYVAYLDDDDMWYINHLEVLSKALDENPDIGVVYSDLYAVQFAKDDSTGRRYNLNKFIQSSRDYNRDLMFIFNHTLHVSLMHRKDLALKAGGYNENVKVLIDWNITRKLSFYTDFKYIPIITGEYYMPIGSSDRISHLGRKDDNKYKKNLRIIKGDLPPEPWPKVDRVAIIFPVFKWTDMIKNKITGLFDSIQYPVKFVIVNNDMDKNESSCRQYLEEMGSLDNIWVFTPSEPLNVLQSYRFGALSIDADYVYLPTENADTGLEIRIIKSRHFPKSPDCDGLKWDREQEINGAFDILMEKDLFLEKSDPACGDMRANIEIIPDLPPASLACDLLYNEARRQYEAKNFKLAKQCIKEAATIKRGGAGFQFLVDIHSRIFFELHEYDEAEAMIRELIARGYGADNYVRLGQILQKKKKFTDAIKAYENGLIEIGLNESDLDCEAFPIATSQDFSAFLSIIGIGECCYEIGKWTKAARMFRKAARLKANSYRTFLGFGKLFLKDRSFERAEDALLTANSFSEDNSEIFRLLGKVHEESGRIDSAFEYYMKAYEKDKDNHENIDGIYRTGVKSGKQDDVIKILEDFLMYNQGATKGICYLAEIYIEQGCFSKAEGLLFEGLVLDPGNPELLGIYGRIKESAGR